MRTVGVCLALMTLACAALGAEDAKRGAKPILLKPLQGARILFLGDSITYSGGYVEAIDGWLFAHCPDQRYELINIGLPSETVSGLTEPEPRGRSVSTARSAARAAGAGAGEDEARPGGRLLRHERRHLLSLRPTTLREVSGGAALDPRRRAQGGREVLGDDPPPFDPQPIRNSLLPAGRADIRPGSLLSVTIRCWRAIRPGSWKSARRMGRDRYSHADQRLSHRTAQTASGVCYVRRRSGISTGRDIF